MKFNLGCFIKLDELHKYILSQSQNSIFLFRWLITTVILHCTVFLSSISLMIRIKELSRQCLGYLYPVCSRLLPAGEQEGQREDRVNLYVATWCTHMTIRKQFQALKLRYNRLELKFGQADGNNNFKFFKGKRLEESWADKLKLISH